MAKSVTKWELKSAEYIGNGAQTSLFCCLLLWSAAFDDQYTCQTECEKGGKLTTRKKRKEAMGDSNHVCREAINHNCVRFLHSTILLSDLKCQ